MRGRTMQILAAGTVVLSAVATPPLAHSEDVGEGPLALRSQFPLELLLPSHEPLPPRVRAAGGWSARVQMVRSNTWVRGGDIDRRQRDLDRQDEQVPGYATLIDTEVTRLTTEISAGVGAGVEFGVVLAGMGFAGGFADRWIEEVHDALDLPGDDRATQPRNEVELAVIGEDGVLGFRAAPTSFSLADTLVWGRWMMHPGGDNSSAWMLEAAVELPTGKEEALTGSGGIDGRIGIHGGEGWNGRHFLNWGASRVMISSFEAAPIPVEDAWHVHIGYEFANSHWSIPVQILATDSHFGSGDGKADGERVLLQAGLRRRGTWSWEIGFNQNLTLNDNNEDVALAFGMRWSWGN